jgi:hypothetical protein
MFDGVRTSCGDVAARTYSPSSTHPVALSSDGIIPDRASSAATVRLNNNIAANTRLALATSHAPGCPAGRDPIVVLIRMSQLQAQSQPTRAILRLACPTPCDLKHTLRAVVPRTAHWANTGDTTPMG